MSLIETSMYGELEISEDSIITFTNGIPGFESLRKYTVLQIEEDLAFSYLQSVEEKDLAFIIVNPFLFHTGYEFDIPDAAQEELKITSEKDVAIWSIVTIRDDLQDATMNLVAPIVINIREKLGRQVILPGTTYTTRHKLMPEDSITTTEGD
jgi:flagellar assembly factor FliW